MQQKNQYRNNYSSPLDYYLKHPELHSLSRFELSQEDSGLYRSLVRNGEIDEAIPQKENPGRKPPNRNLVKLVRCLIRNGVPRTEIAMNAGISVSAVNNYYRLDLSKLQ